MKPLVIRGQVSNLIRDFVSNAKIELQLKMNSILFSNVWPNFPEIEDSEKLKIVLNKDENVKLTGQFIIDAFNYRNKIVKKWF